MSLKKAIQDAITDALAAGTFYRVSYGTDRKPVVSTETQTPGGIAVNEVSAALTQSTRNNARTGQQTLTNWIFEARVKFNGEVDLTKFLTEELKTVGFNYQNTVRVRAIPGTQIAHPPRQGSGGTELVINFTVNTRR